MSIHFIDVITATNAYNTRLVKAKSKSFIYLYMTTIIYFLSNSISAFPLQGYHFSLWCGVTFTNVIPKYTLIRYVYKKNIHDEASVRDVHVGN